MNEILSRYNILIENINKEALYAQYKIEKKCYNNALEAFEYALMWLEIELSMDINFNFVNKGV